MLWDRRDWAEGKTDSSSIQLHSECCRVKREGGPVGQREREREREQTIRFSSLSLFSLSLLSPSYSSPLFLSLSLSFFVGYNCRQPLSIGLFLMYRPSHEKKIRQSLEAQSSCLGHPLFQQQALTARPSLWFTPRRRVAAGWGGGG